VDTDRDEVVFDPHYGDRSPCEHFVWLDWTCTSCRFGQDGSKEIDYTFTEALAHSAIHDELDDFFRDYSRMPNDVVKQFAPSGEHELADLFLEIKDMDSQANESELGDPEDVRYEVEGFAVFAREPESLIHEIMTVCEPRRLDKGI